MTTRSIKLSHLAILLGIASLASTHSVQAALVGASQTFPDVTATASPYLVYDHDGGGAGIGQLRLFSGGTSFAEPASAGGTTQSQSYFAAGDSIPDLDLTINIDNTTGAFLSGAVSIGFGNNTSAARFKWDGTITDFGFANTASGVTMDGFWNATYAEYQNWPATLSQYVNCSGSCGNGGFIISLGAPFNGTPDIGAGLYSWGSDWILGSSATTTTSLNTYTGGLTSPTKTNVTVAADVFVPLPETFGMMLGGMSLLVPLMRRKNRAHRLA